MRARFLLLAGLWFPMIGASPPAVGQDQEQEFIDFGYAAWYGTGFYTVADRDVAVIRLPFRWDMRDSDRSSGEWGWRWRLPVTVGFYQFDFDLENIENVQTASFIPGAAFQIPLYDIWELQPFVQAGIGHDFSNDNSAWVYGTGVRSFVYLSSYGVDYRIANRLLLAGQTQRESGDRTGFTSFEAGLDVGMPGSFKMFDRDVNINLFGLITWFGNRADFLESIGETNVSRIYELGFSLGSQKDIRVWKFDIPRVGMSYLVGDNGFRGIRFNLGFPF